VSLLFLADLTLFDIYFASDELLQVICYFWRYQPLLHNTVMTELKTEMSGTRNFRLENFSGKFGSQILETDFKKDRKTKTEFSV
jgi:hypothetical protein